MPELPEVETVMRGVAPSLTGGLIERAEARRPDLRWPLPERFADRLLGRRIAAFSRRSKFILAELDDAMVWIIHLGMSGRIAIGPLGAAASPTASYVHAAPSAVSGDGPHDHVLVETETHRFVYTDARRFGAMDLVAAAGVAEHAWLRRLGPEPFDAAFNAEALAARLERRVASIKSMLLDQSIVAGLGNIYVCEALFAARIDPLKPAGAVSLPALRRLVKAVRVTLEAAIAAGGSSLRDHRQADGDLGYFQHSFAVYGRVGDPCARRGCDGVIVRTVQSGRSSFHCPACQK